MPPVGFYLHVPFCVRKCPYCDFYSIAREQGHAEQTAYVEALERELQTLPEDFKPQTVFIGGGTPTELTVPLLTRVLTMLSRYIDLDAVQEWTCESNPGTLTEEKAQLLRAAGVNRLSIGAQSFQPALLAFLGRIHGPEEIDAAIALARAGGFSMLNLDLIHSVPGSSEATLDADLDLLLAGDPEHVACYHLIVEEGTPFHRQRAQGTLQELGDDQQYAQYERARQRLRAAGYVHYEISNFAKPGRMCEHNRLYWTGGDYIGCGPSAHSHWAGRRYANLRGLQPYMKALNAGRSPVTFSEQLPPAAKARETLVMQLRELAGVNRAGFQDLTGFDYRDLCGPVIDRLCEEQWLQEVDGNLSLTEKALFVSDAVMAELV